MTRPDPPSLADWCQPGWRYVAVLDEDWLVLGPADRARRCRAGAGYHKRACGAPAVALLRRRRSRYDPPYGSVPVWWAYCAEHMYRRWIEDVDGRRVVMSWRLRGPKETE